VWQSPLKPKWVWWIRKVITKLFDISPPPKIYKRLFTFYHPSLKCFVNLCLPNLRHNNNKTSYVSLITSRLAIDLLKININKGDLNSDTIVTYRCGGYGYSSRSSGPRAPVRKSQIPPPSIEPLARPRKSAVFSVSHQRPVKCRARCPIFLSKKRENEKKIFSLQF
jgi:hypothetical protein